MLRQYICTVLQEHIARVRLVYLAPPVCLHSQRVLCVSQIQEIACALLTLLMLVLSVTRGVSVSSNSIQLH